MKLSDVIKRIVPFVTAMVIGLVIAGFFVSVSPFTRAGKNRDHRMNTLKAEVERLKVENSILKRELCEQRRMAYRHDPDFEILLSPPHPEPPRISKRGIIVVEPADAPALPPFPKPRVGR